MKTFFGFQIDTKYLSPLFMAYDDRLEEKNKIILKYQVSINFHIGNMYGMAEFVYI